MLDFTPAFVEPRAPSSPTAPAYPSVSDLDALEALCDRGLFLDAHTLAVRFAPMPSWRDARALTVASRLVHHLGAPKLANSLALRAYRRNPRDAYGLYGAGQIYASARGPLAASRWLEAHEPPATSSHDARTKLLVLRSALAVALRDFDAADALLGAAEALSEGDPRIAAVRGHALERQDRYDEARAFVEGARRRFPQDRVLWQQLVHLLLVVGKESEALALATSAAPSFQSVFGALQLAQAQGHVGDHEGAQQTLAQVVSLSPLLEESLTEGLAAQLADNAYHRGDVTEAIDCARRANNAFYTRFADTLAEGGDARRVRLAVPFVRQHEVTCAPATLTALSLFWGEPADHLAIAEAICYDGTPSHSQRRWCEQQGFLATEFTVTWEASLALLDRGVPFALTTVSVVAGHLQAVMGYDARRGTLLVRDPSTPFEVELPFDELALRCRDTGPRGMVMLPRSEAHRLDGIALPEAAPYDHLHALLLALDAHDRAAASRECDALEARAKESVPALLARRCLAAYDGNSAAILASAESALAVFPSSQRAELDAVSAMTDLATRDARIARLERLAEMDDAHPVFLEMLATELLEDARQARRAGRLLRRVARALPGRAMTVKRLADLAWQRQAFDEALALSRAAMALSGTDEYIARTYFAVARARGRAEEALGALAARASRYVARHGAPALTYAWALELQSRPEASLAQLEAALSRRPDDGALLLEAARQSADSGRLTHARELLERARGNAPRTAYLRVMAHLARHTEKPSARLALWQEIAQSEPLAMDAHDEVSALLASSKGRAAAVDYVTQLAARFPHSRAVRERWVASLAGGSPETRDEAITQLLAHDPDDAWANREKALVALARGDIEGARTACAAAARREPESASLGGIVAEVHLAAGDAAAAMSALRGMLARDADCARALYRAMDVADTHDARVALLTEAGRACALRSISGAGVLAWFESARAVLPQGELAREAAELRRARPDLWATWSIGARERLARAKLDEADAIACEGLARFPSCAELHTDYAAVALARGDARLEITRLEAALERCPLNLATSLRLAEARARMGECERALCDLERAEHQHPAQSAVAQIEVRLLFRLGRRAEAMARARAALSREPCDEALWGQMIGACATDDERMAVQTFARELADRSPWSANARAVTASVLADFGLFDEALSELEKAIEREPLCVEAHERRALIFAHLGKRDEALAACHPKALEASPPTVLAGRAAWIRVGFGDLEGGIAAMTKVVSRDGGYAWGFAQLARWHTARKDYKSALTAAQTYVRLAPDVASAHSIYAVASLARGHRRRAKTHLRRALAIDPTSKGAAMTLFDLAVTDDDVDDAAFALAGFGAEAPEFAASRATLAILRGAPAEALASFERACVTPMYDRGALARHHRALVVGGLGARAAEALDSAMGDANAHFEAGFLWTRGGVVYGGLRYATKAATARIAPGSDAVGGATEALFDAFDPTVDNPLLFVWRHRAWLRSSTSAWAIAANALFGKGHYVACLFWMRDYRLRDGYSASTLFALAASLHACGLARRAFDVSRRALTIAPDATTPMHRVWVAFDNATRRHFAIAREELDRVDADKLPSDLARLAAFTRDMIAAGTRKKSLDGGGSKAIGLPWQFANGLEERAITRVAFEVRSPWLFLRVHLIEAGTLVILAALFFLPGTMRAAFLPLAPIPILAALRLIRARISKL